MVLWFIIVSINYLINCNIHIELLIDNWRVLNRQQTYLTTICKRIKSCGMFSCIVVQHQTRVVIAEILKQHTRWVMDT